MQANETELLAVKPAIDLKIWGDSGANSGAISQNRQVASTCCKTTYDMYGRPLPSVLPPRSP
jgi:DUF2075 family protein